RMMISASTNTGKSILAQQISAAAAGVFADEKLFGQFDVTSGKVLYLDWEMGDSVLKDRFSMMIDGRFEVDSLYVKSMLGIDIGDTEVKEKLEEWIRDLGVNVVVLDPIGSAWHGDENSKEEVNKLTSYLDSLIGEYGISIIVVHHWRKATKHLSGGGQMASGSYKWEAWVDHHITLKGESSSVKLACEKARTGVKFESIIISLNPERLLFEFIGDCKSKYSDEDVITLIGKVCQETGKKEVSIPDLIRYAKEKGGPGKDKIRSIVKSSDKIECLTPGKTHFVRLKEEPVSFC
ncbi:AAA family ATPase, partial [Patescibacteria group bacterium]|nr:AAA family ATPase [Patescibacteria group bacterium]